MAKAGSVPEAPGWLQGTLRQRYAELAPVFYRMGTLSALEVNTLARYILAENNYLQVSTFLQNALSSGDAEEATKWLTAQDRLLKQISSLGEMLGLTAEKRKAAGWVLPG